MPFHQVDISSTRDFLKVRFKQNNAVEKVPSPDTGNVPERFRPIKMLFYVVTDAI